MQEVYFLNKNNLNMKPLAEKLKNLASFHYLYLKD
jgi:hypothetical protein